MRYLPVILAVGALIYGLIWLMQARARRSSGPPPATRGRRGPVAPDDDPEFLAELDRLRRAEERKRRGGPAADADPQERSTTPTEGGPVGPPPQADRPAATEGGTVPEAGGTSGADEAPGTEADDGSHR